MIYRVVNSLGMSTPRLSRQWITLGEPVRIARDTILTLIAYYFDGAETPELMAQVDQPIGRHRQLFPSTERFALPASDLIAWPRAHKLKPDGRLEAVLFDFSRVPERRHVVY